MAKTADLTPNNVHWIDYYQTHGRALPTSNNYIRISAENLAKLKKELKKGEQ